MKLRIRGNTLRLRLSRNEVDSVARGKEVGESTSFPGGGKLQYVLKQTASATTVIKTNDNDRNIWIDIFLVYRMFSVLQQEMTLRDVSHVGLSVL